MDTAQLNRFVNGVWDDTITPTLVDYIKIPNKSPAFEPDWASLGHMDKAVELIEGWCKEQQIEGLIVEVVRLEGRTPLIYMEVPGDRSDDCVLLYGHLDKQPEMTGWFDDLGPWKPVLKDDKLYGRGGADDGYAAFASLPTPTTLGAGTSSGGSISARSTSSRCCLSRGISAPVFPAAMSSCIPRR